jgi:hypothetical protein
MVRCIVPRSAALLLLVFASLPLAGCGIAFGDAPQGNDFFTSLRVSGEKRAGAPLTASVSYETFYPLQIEILCELRQGSRTIREIGRGFAPAILPEREPDDDAVPGNFSIDFSVETAGSYKVECYTVLDEANFVIEEFEISGG